MQLRDIGHVIKALELLHASKQELLMIQNQPCCSFFENIENIEKHLTKTLVDQSGKEWSND